MNNFNSNYTYESATTESNRLYDQKMNFFKYFLTYDYMKFQQFIDASTKIKCENFSKRKIHRNFSRLNKIKRKRLYSTKKTDKNDYDYDNVINKIFYKLNEMNHIQKETDTKVDYLINRNSNFEFGCETFNFEIIQNKHEPIFDYFSFKIKPELSLTSSVNELKNLNTAERSNGNYKKNKCYSPDRLISHKFFEDSEHFRNSNLMSVKTFLNENVSTSNPFCMTARSDTNNKEQTFEKLFKSDDKKCDIRSNKILNCNNQRETDNKCENFFTKENDISISITNFSEREIDKYKKTKESEINIENISNFPNNIQISEEENSNISINYFGNSFDKRENSYQSKQLNSNITYTCNTDNNDTISVGSSKINADPSQDKFKKVRGFNFKNNINTKKYMKPLFNSKAKSDEKSEDNINIQPNNHFTKLIDTNNSRVNKSVNIEEVINPCIKKFNFNNNMKKFIKQQDYNNAINASNKEREKLYAIEIEESENENHHVDTDNKLI